MPEDTRVLYNDTCPVCRIEIDAYRRRATAAGAALQFDALDRAADWGLTPDQAARQLHVRVDGQVIGGFAAFRAIWARLPRWRWLARVTALPVIAPLLEFAYARIAAPVLYRMHLRRQGRQGR
ncbi:MAG: hypothetical protein RIT14_1155 [Pseudomonadota bacterium]|jgi:predicted DCC family thiol-disulfide oxidoreductase YuxK